MMRSKIKNMVSMWFVSRLDETRVSRDEKQGIKLISKAFGKQAWDCSVIVFTFANSVPVSEYKEAVDKRTELIRREIAKYVGEDIANQIP
jgi:AIG1 family